ncbi:MAG: SWI/SNF-related matrix-associated actin-dependent regulator of chromatin subfamily A-like protein 1, partial [Solirubrobacteraceae bacterium]|nr:SWI/SNF-related matrix-associated actin-dependent regulator of chromatin subfamily A-like protein 1 [Solirubrobacteraceae bacterium]
MQRVSNRPNVELRRDAEGEQIVVLAFPYDAHIVAAVRTIPHRRFDWDSREWQAPADDWNAVHVADVLARFPDLTTSADIDAWLAAVQLRWVGRVGTARFDGRGWWVLQTRAGTIPESLLEGSVPQDGAVLVPLTRAHAAVLADQAAARMDPGAQRCLIALQRDEDPPPLRLTMAGTPEGERLRLEVLWDPDGGAAFAKLPATEHGGRTLPLDPWIIESLDAFIGRHGVAVDGPAGRALATLRAEYEEAAAAVRSSRAMSAEPIAETAAVLGGELAPFQWAAVHYALAARRTFLADEQGLGKTVEALAALEADGAFPALVVCPASLKLNWEREATRWLPHRTVAVVEGRVAVPPTAEITILNYEIVAAHHAALARLRPRALVVDEAHYCKNPQAKRTRAVRRLAESITPGGLRLALTGTPVLNHAEELISQLRVIGRLPDFGSGAQFRRDFRADRSEERLHWHLRRRCFVRRLKSEVLPQLPAKRQVVIPVGLTNEREYRVAEKDVIEWLRQQPLDLKELNARIAATLRAERLAQLGTLQRLAARGKLDAALGRQLRQHLGLQAPDEAAPAQVPVEPLLGERTLELAREARAGAEVLEAPDDPQLADQLLGVVEHGGPGQREAQPLVGDGAREAADGLRALGLRVLAVVRLVDDERSRAQAGELVAVGGDDLVVDDRDVAGGRDGDTPLNHRDAAVRQPAARLALPVELERRRADDHCGEGVVGLQRGERLDRLAEALLVGQERASRVEHVPHARPLERLERAAEPLGDLGDRLGAGRPRAADGVRRVRVLGAQLAQHPPGAAVDGDAVQGEEAVERLDDPRIERHRVSRLVGAGQLVEGGAGLGVPEDVELQMLAVDALVQRQPGGRDRVLAAVEGGDASLRRGVQPRRAD